MTFNINTRKRRLRRRFQRLLQEQPAAIRASEERRLLAALESDPLFKNAQSVLAYYPIDREPNILPLLRKKAAQGGTIFLPRVTESGMEFRRWNNVDDEALVPGKFGIPTTVIEAEIWMTGTHESIILVPGSGFTCSGKRLGRGGGYYDRFLQMHRDLTSIALSFSRQLAGNIPVEEHDRCMTKVIHLQ